MREERECGRGIPYKGRGRKARRRVRSSLEYIKKNKQVLLNGSVVGME